MSNLNKILDDIKICCKKISNIIRYSNSLDMEKLSNEYNLSGDNAKKLDLISNEILKSQLLKCKYIRVIGSEEEKQLVNTEFTNAPYMICFDPLDGSSNIGVNITTGTIFAVYKYNKNNKIKDGNDIVMAGYCLYGGSTQLVVAKETVNIYQLNKDFEIISENWVIPNKGKFYAINESNRYCWLDNRNIKLINKLISENYSARWVGSLVADGHRTLIKGGFFGYPGNSKHKKGKIRLLYEAYPFSFIFKVAGGCSYNSMENIFLLDVPYSENNCHQKTPIILSSKYEFDLFININ
jgi:fructose-1,6-bisphosphatase I